MRGNGFWSSTGIAPFTAVRTVERRAARDERVFTSFTRILFFTGYCTLYRNGAVERPTAA